MRLLTVAALTRGMVRLRLVLLLALMAIAAVEPVLHNHSLIPGQAASDSLKSAAGTFGYARLAALALRLEQSAEKLGDGEFHDLLDLMDAAYAAARAQEPAG